MDGKRGCLRRISPLLKIRKENNELFNVCIVCNVVCSKERRQIMPIAYICSKCKTQSEPVEKKKANYSLPEGWRTLSFTGSTSFSLEFCPPCARKLKIPEERDSQKSYGDEIMELIEEVARDAVEQ